jgi:hypothetical protein
MSTSDEILGRHQSDASCATGDDGDLAEQVCGN